MSTRVAPRSDTIWIVSVWPFPTETLSRELALPLLAGEGTWIVRSAHPSPRAIRRALKPRASTSCSIARAVLLRSLPLHRWNVPSVAAALGGAGGGGAAVALAAGAGREVGVSIGGQAGSEGSAVGAEV